MAVAQQHYSFEPCKIRRATAAPMSNVDPKSVRMRMECAPRHKSGDERHRQPGHHHRQHQGVRESKQQQQQQQQKTKLKFELSQTDMFE